MSWGGSGVGGLGEKIKGSRSTDWELKDSHTGVKYSTGNMVTNIVITVWCHLGAGNIGGTLCKV